jgi:hypothetical protein
MYTTNTHLGIGRSIVCAIAACILTVVLLGSISHASAQVAQVTALELAQA